MSIRNLDVLFKPRSIALIGASKEASSLGAILAHNLFNAGFAGPIMPVNAQHQAIEGVLAYPDPANLPEVADLAVIVAAPRSMPGLISALGERGTRAAVLVSAARRPSTAGCARRSWPRPGPTGCASSAPTASASWRRRPA